MDDGQNLILALILILTLVNTWFLIAVWEKQ